MSIFWKFGYVAVLDETEFDALQVLLQDLSHHLADAEEGELLGRVNDLMQDIGGLS
jgi:hypothetical protein